MTGIEQLGSVGCLEDLSMRLDNSLVQGKGDLVKERQVLVETFTDLQARFLHHGQHESAEDVGLVAKMNVKRRSRQTHGLGDIVHGRAFEPIADKGAVSRLKNERSSLVCVAICHV